MRRQVDAGNLFQIFMKRFRNKCGPDLKDIVAGMCSSIFKTDMFDEGGSKDISGSGQSDGVSGQSDAVICTGGMYGIAGGQDDMP